MPRLGLLAYGSLQWEPGVLEDVLDAMTVVEGVLTPFSVEFARSSASRDGAPTVVPVNAGGARVPSTVIALQNDLNVADAQTLIWRRELGRTDGTYDPRPGDGPNKVLVEPISGVYDGFHTVLAVRIGSNIPNPDGEKLAKLAIKSARGTAGSEERDGISYLRKAKLHGVVTPLSTSYEDAVLQRLGVESLQEALIAARSLDEFEP
jgi:hypothetical protein